jgi:phosphatidylglycerophosphate synthase
VTDPQKPLVTPIGDNPIPIWGMSNRERLRRIADKRGLGYGEGDGPRLLVDTRFVFDPPLLAFMAAQPDTALIKDGRAVIAHVRDPKDAQLVTEAMLKDEAFNGETKLARLTYDDDFTLYNNELRKREQPFLMALRPDTVRRIERLSYFGAYKGVTDILTKYLWPEAALLLTRFAARVGATPNMVTSLGALLCIAATILFWHGEYWWGIAAGLTFMVLDTVDGKLARCTITSSKWGNVFDHGIDLVHPPFWWWAWAVGLREWGLAYTRDEFALVLGAILGGYLVQRLIEGAFMRLYGMHIHVWERIDSRFRLITARRNPNMVILFAALLFGRPDVGLTLVAVWTLLSCLFHAVRLVQAMAMARGRGGDQVTSWLR